MVSLPNHRLRADGGKGERLKSGGKNGFNKGEDI